MTFRRNLGSAMAAENVEDRDLALQSWLVIKPPDIIPSVLPLPTFVLSR